MIQILIIDDDPVMQVILKKKLQEQGYEVILARSGIEGIDLAEKHQPALIICDWQMQEMDGLEVCRRIKADRTLSQSFFILLTARSDVEDRIQGLDTGADDFLSKPVEISELKARVRAGLRLYQSNQKLQVLAQDLQLQKQALESELAEAAEYVRSLLPKPITGKINIDSRFLPSRHLGGDCFDYYWLDPDYLLIYLLDVSGHGLSSALPSVTMFNLLRSQSLSGANFYQPDQVLRVLNEFFQMDNQNNQYFTIWYGVYNRQKRSLSYSSAGHPPAILLSSAAPETLKVQKLKTRGTPIGMMPNSKYSTESCEIEAGSTLYVFSDGIYEIRKQDGTVWTLDEFIDQLIQCAQLANSNDLDHVLQQVQLVNHHAPFEDDCSLLRFVFN
ncbi:MAG: SpoIIE family protein phosphatase [Scytolyngbya sp. HA4215-MV1]|jgi:sigma-B regulation protein RsbU (phosphoserine phosphatase)|nr:SpoIIE family protein phosphatase [Scytolyngbya sp. HA4215-MV1]